MSLDIHAHQRQFPSIMVPQRYSSTTKMSRFGAERVKIRWYVDGVHFHTVNIEYVSKSELHTPQYIILNLAVGLANRDAIHRSRPSISSIGCASTSSKRSTGSHRLPGITQGRGQRLRPCFCACSILNAKRPARPAAQAPFGPRRCSLPYIPRHSEQKRQLPLPRPGL